MEKNTASRPIAILEEVSGMIKAILIHSFSSLSVQDREDVEQEIRIKIWNVVVSGKNIDRITLYIRRMIYSITIDYIRKMKRKSPARMIDRVNEEEAVLLAKARVEDTPEYRAQDRELLSQVEDAIDSLLENRRKVVSLHLLGLDIEEMSYFLNWSRNKVRHLLYRGLQDLKDRFKEKGVLYEHSFFHTKHGTRT
ncbi:MAG: sigma-70 family RNA polymerase sigma factor [Candidatus Aminicenantes bacterium]|nr:sigma-70 family RNA polymerase sigma factor [Candidatus Aminicenantes bacterium]